MVIESRDGLLDGPNLCLDDIRHKTCGHHEEAGTRFLHSVSSERLCAIRYVRPNPINVLKLFLHRIQGKFDPTKASIAPRELQVCRCCREALRQSGNLVLDSLLNASQQPGLFVDQTAHEPLVRRRWIPNSGSYQNSRGRAGREHPDSSVGNATVGSQDILDRPLESAQQSTCYQAQEGDVGNSNCQFDFLIVSCRTATQVLPRKAKQSLVWSVQIASFSRKTMLDTSRHRRQQTIQEDCQISWAAFLQALEVSSGQLDSRRVAASECATGRCGCYEYDVSQCTRHRRKCEVMPQDTRPEPKQRRQGKPPTAPGD
mmetsp:Transcript_2529/g.5864  ORF Transcript_2529/g.5864 Transcript_2529/m.5864 type:complete len:315 (-) Transcript_2529:1332-2276(-)